VRNGVRCRVERCNRLLKLAKLRSGAKLAGDLMETAQGIRVVIETPHRVRKISSESSLTTMIIGVISEA